MKKLIVLFIVVAGCTSTRIPHSLELADVNGYMDAGRGRKCSEYTVKILMGEDSVLYQTYWVDRYMWYRLK